ncbi:MAG: hypothetical protein HKN90_08895 [Flavobacteriaceae bacterium]|nr:hypothetical protein [Flavobacteriaceae bacterium]
MKTNKKGNFEFMKDSDDPKTNYILQDNKTTKIGIITLIIVLIILAIMVLYFGLPILN